MMQRDWEALKLEFTYRACKSSGPGGQHVNTTDSSVELRWKFQESVFLSEFQKMQISQKLRTYINKRNEFILTSSSNRSQRRNKEEIQKKMRELLTLAFRIPKKRIATKPSRSAKRKRLDNKKIQGEKKKNRKKIDF